MKVYVLSWASWETGGYNSSNGPLAVYTTEEAAKKAGERYVRENGDEYRECGYEIDEVELKGKLT